MKNHSYEFRELEHKISQAHLHCEKSIQESSIEFYSGNFSINYEALYTNIYDCLKILKSCKSHGLKSLSDLGSGLSPLKMASILFMNGVEVFPIEAIKERALAGEKLCKELGLDNINYFVADLETQPIPPTCAYFFYLPYNKLIRKIIFQVLQRKNTHIYIIESHGDFIENLEFDFGNYLDLIEKIELSGTRHNQYINHYQTKNEEHYQRTISSLLKMDSFSAQDIPLSTLLQVSEITSMQLLIEENTKIWLADACDYSLRTKANMIDFKTPPRSIYVSQVLGAKHFEGNILHYIIARQNLFQNTHGQIRKIYIEPSLQIEYADGNLYTV